MSKENLVIKGNVTKVESESTPSLKALANITIGGVKIDNIKVSERSGYTFVDFPNRKGEDKNGETMYRDIVRFYPNDEEKAKKLKNAISNCILNAFKEADKTVQFEKETSFQIDKSKVGAYINPIESAKAQGVGTIYYGDILAIQPVFLKDKYINFESRQNKEGEYKEIVYPIETGLKGKMYQAALNSYLYNCGQRSSNNLGESKGEKTEETVTEAETEDEDEER